MKMRWFNISKLKFVNFIYWVFLTYMIAAFIWWYVSLEKQNSEIATVFLIHAVKYAYERGIYNIGETEVISKCIRLLSK